jgi:hypothetical protein
MTRGRGARASRGRAGQGRRRLESGWSAEIAGAGPPCRVVAGKRGCPEPVAGTGPRGRVWRLNRSGIDQRLGSWLQWENDFRALCATGRQDGARSMLRRGANDRQCGGGAERACRRRPRAGPGAARKRQIRPARRIPGLSGRTRPGGRIGGRISLGRRFLRPGRPPWRGDGGVARRLRVLARERARWPTVIASQAHVGPAPSPSSLRRLAWARPGGTPDRVPDVKTPSASVLKQGAKGGKACQTN